MGILCGSLLCYIIYNIKIYLCIKIARFFFKINSNILPRYTLGYSIKTLSGTN